MTEARHDVLGIGNAIVDILARAEDDFIVEQKLTKGSMRLVDMMRRHLGGGGLILAATHGPLGIEARELRLGAAA